MDTDPKYRNEAELDVDMGRSTHYLNDDVPIDGQVTILFSHPEKESGLEHGKYRVGDFPFRDRRKDDHPWFARPDNEGPANGGHSKHPVWKWQNPDEPPENITLKPSLGLFDRDGNCYFHCWVEDGAIRFV